MSKISMPLEERRGYQWPASSLTRYEMEILTQLKKKTGCAISELLRQVVELVGQAAQKKGHIRIRRGG